ncbi:voltage-dependent calcium channel beta subunit-associated regulatory protein-like [Fukomys damarensis]|uniref:voltage-dependent calcium channel beta subunit-associated regulatory protein-like n=1 Tax=Fukomys damarensis TaxID=885580 RepID=UPI0008FF1640|nr:voltage-dependent calcium channel beta subunit-associated regulatory protein-like [Fukomys damarensis]
MGSDDWGLACRLEAAEAAGGVSPESPLERGAVSGPEQPELDTEQAQASYRDLWSLRASLELHAATASDHSSSGNDRDSVRSGDSSGSGGTAPAFPPPSPPMPPRPKDGEARRLLQMDSGYASIEGGRGAVPPAPRPSRAPLRRGDSVDCPPEGRALASTGDDLAIPVIEEEPGGGGGGGGCPGSGLCVEPPGELLDKLVAGLEERLFPPRLAEPVPAAPVLVVAAAPTSPDHSPA